MYRREDGTEFEYRQKFSDDPLTTDPETGQKVVRIIQPAGIVFKGSGFYVNDSKGSKSNLSSSSNGNSNGDSADNADSTSKESASDKTEAAGKSGKEATTAPVATTETKKKSDPNTKSES